VATVTTTPTTSPAGPAETTWNPDGDRATSTASSAVVATTTGPPAATIVTRAGRCVGDVRVSYDDVPTWPFWAWFLPTADRVFLRKTPRKLADAPLAVFLASEGHTTEEAEHDVTAHRTRRTGPGPVPDEPVRRMQPGEGQRQGRRRHRGPAPRDHRRRGQSQRPGLRSGG